jgi:hypothetical protein
LLRCARPLSCELNPQGFPISLPSQRNIRRAKFSASPPP